MVSAANNKAPRCDTCHALFDKTKLKRCCACKRFKFCNNECYSNRPMREWHREECDKKVADRKTKAAERKAASISLKRSEAAKEQPREANGQMGKKKNSDDEQAVKNRLHTATSKAIKRIREEGQHLQQLRKQWQIRFLVVRNEKGCKTNPVIFETKNFNTKIVRDEVSDNHELNLSNPRDIDLSYEESDDEEVPSNERKPTYRCYICNILTGTKKGIVCAEQEENKPCQNGAACLNCINLDMKRLSASDRKIIRNNWRCPIHKSTSGRTDPVDEDLDIPEDSSKKKTNLQELSKKKTKKRPVGGRRVKLLSISDDLRTLMPEVWRDKEHFTRAEISKAVHQYINTRPELKVLNPQTKVRLVHPDERLAAVYGTVPFKGFSKIPQLTDHVKETGLYESSQNVDETSNNIGDGTPAENVAGTSGTNIQIPSSPVLRRSQSVDASMSSPDDTTDSGSSVFSFRVPKKFINPQVKRTLTFRAPPQVPPAVKAKANTQYSEENDSHPAVSPEDVDDTVKNLQCKTCLFPLFKETEEMKKEPIKNKKKVIRCPVCLTLIHESCYLGLTGCETCS